MKQWNKAQEWEKEWWGNCANTLNEELKQLIYAEKMGLVQTPDPKTPYNFSLDDISVLDIGGGPVSLLLKCKGFYEAVVVDPLPVPSWVNERYKMAGIIYWQIPAEELRISMLFDECWIYNCLQHTHDPQEIIRRAKESSHLIRIFEWLDTESNVGHPQVLTESKLNKWLHGEGKVEYLDKGPCVGKAYYGVFPK